MLGRDQEPGQAQLPPAVGALRCAPRPVLMSSAHPLLITPTPRTGHPMPPHSDPIRPVHQRPVKVFDRHVTKIITHSLTQALYPFTFFFKENSPTFHSLYPRDSRLVTLSLKGVCLGNLPECLLSSERSMATTTSCNSYGLRRSTGAFQGQAVSTSSGTALAHANGGMQRACACARIHGSKSC